MPGVFIELVLVAILVFVAYKIGRRSALRSLEQDQKRHRAVLTDAGDEATWEMVKLLPIVDVKLMPENLITKRTFLKRAALALSASLAAWLAARGHNVAIADDIDTSSRLRKAPASDPVPLQDHTDTHTDSSPHYDNAHSDATVTGPNGNPVHGDVPHVDSSTHLDSHIDS
jgi:hypothetical protein